MLKNILAAIGLAVVAKAVYEHYCEYQDLESGGKPPASEIA
ncbi:hypothetical protein ACQKFE_08405 [Stutzerimonas stutzeri]